MKIYLKILFLLWIAPSAFANWILENLNHKSISKIEITRNVLTVYATINQWPETHELLLDFFHEYKTQLDVIHYEDRNHTHIEHHDYDPITGESYNHCHLCLLKTKFIPSDALEFFLLRVNFSADDVEAILRSYRDYLNNSGEIELMMLRPLKPDSLNL